MAPADEKREQPEPVDLKDPGLAAFLAWLLPGLGHLYQGRKAKACLFFVCIMGTFLYGLYLSSGDEILRDHRRIRIGWGRAVYSSWRVGDKRLAYFCQVGVGLPALPALAQAYQMNHGRKVLWGGFMAPPRMAPSDPGQNRADANRDQPTADDLHYHLHPYLELGKHFTMIAGLLNILAIYDAWGGPVFTELARRKEDDEDQEGEDADAPPEVHS